MKIETFLKSLGRGCKDPGFSIITKQDWMDVLNFNIGELGPKIFFKGTITKVKTDLSDGTYQISLAAEPEYVRIEDVDQVWIIDANGKEWLYDNFTYDKANGILDFDPASSKQSDVSIGDAETIKIIWKGYASEFTSINDEIDLSLPKLNLLALICKREAFNQIVMDQTKLDRYRVMVGRMNEFVLLQIITQMTTQIEIKKRELADNQVDTF